MTIKQNQEYSTAHSQAKMVCVTDIYTQSAKKLRYLQLEF